MIFCNFKKYAALYLTAHLKLLSYIEIRSFADVQKFTDSISNNTDPLYMNAVKSIHIGVLETGLNKDDMFNLFFRFPNLKKITIDYHRKFFSDINDQLCEEFLQKCPNINHFVVIDDSSNQHYDEHFYTNLYKLRQVLTDLDVEAYPGDLDGKGEAEYACCFPRLKRLQGSFLSLSFWIPILEKLPYLDDFIIGYNDGENFEESFLANSQQATGSHQTICKSYAALGRMQRRF